MRAAPFTDQLRKRHGLAALILILVFAGINSDLLRGLAMPPYDADEFYCPAYTLVADFARAGHFLLWDIWMNAGLPSFVEPQTGAFSPLQLAFGLMTGATSAGFRLYFSFIWLLSGLGMLCLGRRLHAPAWGTLVVAIGYLFSGYHLGHAQHVSFLYSIGLLPFSLVLIDRAIERRSPLSAAQAGCLWGLSLLGGYPAAVLNNGAFCGLWALGRGIFFPAPALVEQSTSLRRRARSTVVLLSVMVLVGVAIMSPVLLGLRFDAAGVTGRVEALPRALAVSDNSLGPMALTTLFSPYFARLPPALLWRQTDYSSVSMYLGAATLALAFWALLAGPQRKARWALFGVAVLAAMLAMGEALPLRGWLYDLVPPTRYFRHAAMYRGYSIVALAILALVGARQVDESPARDPRFLVAAVLGGVLTYKAFRTVTPIASDALLPSGVWQAQVVWAGVAFVGVIVACVNVSWRRPLVACALCGLAFWDARATSAIDTIHITRDPIVLNTWAHLDLVHVSDLDITKRYGLDRLATTADHGLGRGLSSRNVTLKRPVLLGYNALKNSFHDRWTTNSILQATAVGPNRIWFTPAAPTIDPSEALFQRFMARADQLHGIPLVVHTPEAMQGPAAALIAEWPGRLALAAAPQAQQIAYRLLRYTPWELNLDVDAASDGWLLVTDRWAPGWRVSVNEQPVPNFAGDFIFRAVPVVKGTNRVRMIYRPLTFPGLLILSWTCIALVALLTALTRHPTLATLAAQLRSLLPRLN
jgi:hypothetical protein